MGGKDDQRSGWTAMTLSREKDCQDFVVKTIQGLILIKTINFFIIKKISLMYN